MMANVYRFRFEGLSALLMHHDNVEASDQLGAVRKAMSRDEEVAGDDRSPAWTWQTYLYHDGEHVAFPAENIMAMLMQAASEITLKGNKSFKERSQAGLLIEDEFCRFTVGGKQIKIADIEKLKSKPFLDQVELVRKLGFRLFTKRAGVNGKKHVRVRPRFDQWEVEGLIHVLDAEMGAKLAEALEIGGSRKGLGDWRPASPRRPGPYGRFVATLKKA